jgi:hypothetical protein
MIAYAAFLSLLSSMGDGKLIDGLNYYLKLSEKLTDLKTNPSGGRRFTHKCDGLVAVYFSRSLPPISLLASISRKCKRSCSWSR